MSSAVMILPGEIYEALDSANYFWRAHWSRIQAMMESTLQLEAGRAGAVEIA